MGAASAVEYLLSSLLVWHELGGQVLALKGRSWVTSSRLEEQISLRNQIFRPNVPNLCVRVLGFPNLSWLWHSRSASFEHSFIFGVQPLYQILYLTASFFCVRRRLLYNWQRYSMQLSNNHPIPLSWSLLFLGTCQTLIYCPGQYMSHPISTSQLPMGEHFNNWATTLY